MSDRNYRAKTAMKLEYLNSAKSLIVLLMALFFFSTSAVVSGTINRGTDYNHYPAYEINSSSDGYLMQADMDHYSAEQKEIYALGKMEMASAALKVSKDCPGGLSVPVCDNNKYNSADNMGITKLVPTNKNNLNGRYVRAVYSAESEAAESGSNNATKNTNDKNSSISPTAASVEGFSLELNADSEAEKRDAEKSTQYKLIRNSIHQIY